MTDDYIPTTWIDSMWKIRKSPIAEEADRWLEQIKPETIHTSQFRCYICGDMKWNGISNVLDGTFKCTDCMLKEKMNQLWADVSWQKRERIFNMRRAREKHKIDSQARRSVDAAIERESKRSMEEALKPKEPFKIGGVYENCL